MICKFVCRKTAFQPASKFSPIDKNELFVSPASIRPSLDFLGSWGNDSVHYLIDLIVTPFGWPTVIGGLLDVFCSYGLLGLNQCPTAPLSDVTILGFKVISAVGPTDLT